MQNIYKHAVYYVQSLYLQQSAESSLLFSFYNMCSLFYLQALQFIFLLLLVSIVMYIYIRVYLPIGWVANGGVLLSLWSLVQTYRAIRQQQSTLYCIKNPLIKGGQLVAKYSHRMRYFFKIFRIEFSREPTKDIVSICEIQYHLK